MGYRHIPNLYKDTTILQFRSGYALEKIHGCLHAKTHIWMADGGRKKITDVQVGDIVWGQSKDGQLVPTVVRRCFNNGPSSVWLKVTGTRRGGGRGGNRFVIYCTPNHKFFTPNTKEYVAASSMAIGGAAAKLFHKYLRDNSDLAMIEARGIQ